MRVCGRVIVQSCGEREGEGERLLGTHAKDVYLFTMIPRHPVESGWN